MLDGVVPRRRPSRASLITVFALWVTILATATAFLGAEAARAMSTVAAWSGAFVAFILLGTGWIKPALITAGFVLVAIAATQLIGR